MHSSIAIFSNPFSKQSAIVTGQVSALLDAREIAFRAFCEHWPETLDGYAQAWIVGGDGTLNYFINKYPGAGIPLTIFKAGTGNDFHWYLYGKTKPEEQVVRALLNNTVSIDAACCNDKLFINGLGIGFDGAICQDLSGKKKLPGKISYLLSAIKQVTSYKEKNCNIVHNDQASCHQAFMITVANGRRLGGGFLVAPAADMKDGKLDLIIIEKVSLLNRLLHLTTIEKGKHLHLHFVKHNVINQVVISASTCLPAHADGEFFLADKFRIKVLPAKFRFLV